MSLPIVVALVGAAGRPQRDRHPVRRPRHARDRHHRGDDARPRRRHRLRAVHPGPAPSEPREGMPVPEAIGRANATAGLSVLFAGVTVVVAIAGLQVSGIPMMTMMGWASALMVAVVDGRRRHPAARRCSASSGKRVNSLRVPFIKQKPANDPTVEVGAVDGQGRRQAGPLRRWWQRCMLGDPRHPGVLDAARLRRRRQRRAGSTTRKAYDLMADKLRSRRQRPARGRRRDRRLPKARGRVGDLSEAMAADDRASPRSTSRRLSPKTGPGGHQRHAHDRAAGREDRPTCSTGCAPTSSRQRVGDTDVEASVTGATAHGRRHLLAAAAADAVVPRRRDRPGVPGADARVPVGAGAAQGRAAQRAQRRCGVRRGRGRVPVGLGCRA